jgi:hypothetical protein
MTDDVEVVGQRDGDQPSPRLRQSRDNAVVAVRKRFETPIPKYR